jgi:kumamolisin
MSGSRLRQFFAIIAVLSLAIIAHPARTAPLMVPIPGNVLPVLARASIARSKAAQATQRLVLTFSLRRDDQNGFDRYLHAVYEPHSAIYRRFLTQQQIADRFGPSRRNYNALIAYLRGHGFTITAGSTNRLTVTTSVTRAQAERALGIRIRDYNLGQREFYANDRDPVLPVQIASSVQSVQGLSDYAQPQRAFKDLTYQIVTSYCAAVNDIQSVSFTIQDACKAITNKIEKYEACVTAAHVTLKHDDPFEQQLQKQLSAARSKNCTYPGDPVYDGTGQKIGLLEFSGFNTADVQNFLALIGYSSTVFGNFSEIKLNGGAAVGPYESEVLLDADSVLTITPGAKVVVYNAPFSAPGSSFQQLFNAMISDGDTVISNSWFYCENQTTAADAQSIDSILANAAASGITVLNATGDSGSMCGPGNSIAVPADSPHGTAVGGSTVTSGPGDVYASEKWWNTLAATPPGGAGGYGVSQFFSAPTYQAGLSGSAMRSVPDLVLEADPSDGVQICQADAGGCPTGLLYGGTSNSTPIMAAVVAQLNQELGRNLGELNPLIYPLANTAAFNNAVALNSDFAHVGLGSPKIDALALALSGQTAGAPDAGESLVGGAPSVGGGISPQFVPADGATPASVVVEVLDANDHAVSGQTVALSANAGASATISPASVASNDYGQAVFSVTDLNAENVTLTATAGAVTITQTTEVDFFVPSATTAGLVASPSNVTADGVTPATITLTLQDSLGRPTPGKLIQLTQDGNSVISGPNPPVTDNNGQIVFTAVDTHNETVTYGAIDVTDGNLPVPPTNTDSVSFNNSPAPGCVPGNPTPAPGYVVVPVATGFQAANFSYGGVNWGACPGAFGPAFDSSGNMYVSDFVDGYMYKFPPGGGVANSSTRLTTTSLPTLAQPVFSNGNLYVSQAATGGGQSQIWQVNTTSGALTNVLSPSPSGIICGDYLAADPISGDLFSEDAGCGCTGAIWRVSNPGSGSASLSVYATLPTCPAYALSFSSGGELYAEDGTPTIYAVSPTSVSPTTVTSIYTAPAGNIGVFPGLGLVAGGTGTGSGAQYLLFNQPNSSGPNAQTAQLDLGPNPPTVASLLTSDSMLGNRHLVMGPDGCLYGTGGTAVFKITNTNGACTYTTMTKPLTLTLNPTGISPNPTQGTRQSFTASFHYGTVPDGTPVFLDVSGANPLHLQSATVAGAAPFSYLALHQGVDTLVASTLISGTAYASNTAVVTYTAGPHAMFLTLNASPDAGIVGLPINLSANLTDESVSPIAPLSGQTVNFSLGGLACSGVTDANGNATCQVTPNSAGFLTLSASYAGNATYLAASDAKQVVVTAPTPTATATSAPTPPSTATATPTETATPSPTPTSTAAPTITATSGPTATASPSPQTGRLIVVPSDVSFADTPGHQTPPRRVTAINVSRPQIEIRQVFISGAGFSIVDNGCQGTLSKSDRCSVVVGFSPQRTGKSEGTLTFVDSAENSPQIVRLQGIVAPPSKDKLDKLRVGYRPRDDD